MHQIEKECLAIVWGCEKFHIYLYGRKFTVVSDNKALQYILNNESKRTPARIERWSLRLMPYDFVVKHISGVNNPADFLSRKPVVPLNLDIDDAEHFINYVFHSAIPKTVTYEEIV